MSLHRWARSSNRFGEVTEEGPNYRNLGWLGTVALIMRTQTGPGVLSIPSVFDSVGLVPGVILLCGVASIATWTSYMVGAFKLRHREVYSIDDAGGLMFGRVEKEVFGTAFYLYWILVAGSGILGISISLNAISAHGAFLIVTVSVGIQDRPSSAPQVGPWSSVLKVSNSPLFAQGVSTVSSLIFACSATPAYFAIAAEMRDPRFFTRALVVSQTGSTVIYLVISIVVYYYCGSYVASPALGSAGSLIKQIAYGIALPGLLLATATIVTHLPSKYIFIRILRGSVHLTSNNTIHWFTWLSCTFRCTIIVYLISSGIPLFSSLVSLIGALLGASLAYQPTGCMWFYDNRSRRDTRNWRRMFMACWSFLIIVVGSFLTIAGTYGSIVSIVDSLAEDGESKPWTCADNSNS